MYPFRASAKSGAVRGRAGFSCARAVLLFSSQTGVPALAAPAAWYPATYAGDLDTAGDHDVRLAVVLRLMLSLVYIPVKARCLS